MEDATLRIPGGAEDKGHIGLYKTLCAGWLDITVFSRYSDRVHLLMLANEDRNGLGHCADNMNIFNAYMV